MDSDTSNFKPLSYANMMKQFCNSPANMSFGNPPNTAIALSPFLPHRSSIPEPLDCSSPPVLDLCTRRRPSVSPHRPESAHLQLSPSPPMLPMSMDHLPISPPGMFTSLPMPEVDSSEEGSVKSDMQDVSLYAMGNQLGNQKAKVPRPFKAYPKDPFFLAIGASTADAMLGQESTEAYAEFRRKMLSQVRANNPLPGVTNAKMRRSNLPTSTEDYKEGRDASYWEKRKKNNEAAKRSRDARRAKEDEIAIRAAFLEQENLKLKYEVATLRNETTKLRCLLYN